MEDLSGLTLVPSIIFPYAILIAFPELKSKLNALCFCRINGNVINPTQT
jgi:hypothetical protein